MSSPDHLLSPGTMNATPAHPPSITLSPAGDTIQLSTHHSSVSLSSDQEPSSAAAAAAAAAAGATTTDVSIEIQSDQSDPIKSHSSSRRPSITYSHPDAVTGNSPVAWIWWFGMKIMNAFTPNMDSIALTQKEYGIFHEYGYPLMIRQYLHWRACGLFLAAFMSIIVLIMQLYQLPQQLKDLKEDSEAVCFSATQCITLTSSRYLPIGKTQLAFSIIVQGIALLTIIIAAYKYTHWRMSRRVLQCGFLLSFIMPFVIFMIPLSHLVLNVDFSVLKTLSQDLAAVSDMLQSGVTSAIRVQYSIDAFRYVMPAILGLLTGSRRGAFIVKSMFPQSVWLGYVIRFFPMVYFPVLLAVASIIQQLLGNWYWLIAIVSYGLAEFTLSLIGTALCQVTSDGNTLTYNLRYWRWSSRFFIIFAIPFFILLLIQNDIIPDPVITVFQMFPSTLANILVFAIVISDIFLVIIHNVYTREHADPKQMGYMMTLIHDSGDMIGNKKDTRII